MTWRSGQPNNIGYYLCAVVGNSNPCQLYWNGAIWAYMRFGFNQVGNDAVLYYMSLDDIPMPDGW